MPLATHCAALIADAIQRAPPCHSARMRRFARCRRCLHMPAPPAICYARYAPDAAAAMRQMPRAIRRRCFTVLPRYAAQRSAAAPFARFTKSHDKRECHAAFAERAAIFCQRCARFSCYVATLMRAYAPRFTHMRRHAQPALPPALRHARCCACRLPCCRCHAARSAFYTRATSRAAVDYAATLPPCVLMALPAPCCRCCFCCYAAAESYATLPPVLMPPLRHSADDCRHAPLMPLIRFCHAAALPRFFFSC